MVVVSVDRNAEPGWMRTGYTFFPYAAEQAGHWWVLRFNVGFPEHDMYTLFVDKRVAVDVTGDAGSEVPLVVSVGALERSGNEEPLLDVVTALAVVGAVAGFVEYGSERGDPCVFCSDGRDGLTRDA